MSSAIVGQRLAAYLVLMRLNKPIGTLLLLWPMLWALWIAAEGVPEPWVLCVFLLGTVMMRSAGCVINDYADQDFDGAVARTRERPLATGRVSGTEALLVFFLLVTASACLVWTMNRLTVQLAVIGVLLAVIYPYMKRRTYLPQVFLGLAFGWAVPMAFAAQIDATPPLAWVVMTAAVVWAIVYDTQYAMVDRDDDIRIGIKSTAILFGDADRFMIGVFQVLFLLNLGLIGREAGLGWPFAVTMVATALLFAYQQVLTRERERGKCFAAFMNNNWVGGIIFLGIAASYAN